MRRTTKWKLKDTGSAITHLIGLAASVVAGIPLLYKAAREPGDLHLAALTIFVYSLILLYAASSLYHSLNLSEKGNRRLKKFDHMMISVLIAGTYTPVCLLVLPSRYGLPLLLLIWAVALAGILIKAFWVTCPRWFSSFLYISMGWLCLLALPALLTALPQDAFLWLLAGGLIYTAGGIIYALKLPAFNARHRHFGTHEIFHLFVMGGSLCHYVLFYQFVA